MIRSRSEACRCPKILYNEVGRALQMARSASLAAAQAQGGPHATSRSQCHTGSDRRMEDGRDAMSDGGERGRDRQIEGCSLLLD